MLPTRRRAGLLGACGVVALLLSSCGRIGYDPGASPASPPGVDAAAQARGDAGPASADGLTDAVLREAGAVGPDGPRPSPDGASATGDASRDAAASPNGDAPRDDGASPTGDAVAREDRAPALDTPPGTDAAPAPGGPGPLSGSYIGDGRDDRAITVGFRPEILFIRNETEGGTVVRTSVMTGDVARQLASGRDALAPDLVQAFTADGFVVGTQPAVNAAGARVHWLAFPANPGAWRAGAYRGTFLPQSITGLGFSPELVFLFRDADFNPAYRFAGMARATTIFGSDFADGILSLDADGFTLGGSGHVNGAGASYFFVAWNELPGRVRLGSYVGDQQPGRALTGVGFPPEAVLVQCLTASATLGLWKPRTLAAVDGSLTFAGAPLARDAITKLLPDGFEVGIWRGGNAAGETCHYAAFGR